jgi:hypothetical protein
MCARRFLIAIFILTLIAVAGAFAMFQWGGQVLIKQGVPHGHFEAVAAGDAPDYRSPRAWIARPDLPDDPSRWTPDIPDIDFQFGPAAVFYIHPTTYLKRDRWNAPLLSGDDTEFRTRLFVQTQASAFQEAGRIWAPRYRQAAFGAFLLKSGDAHEALDLAYRDVAAAFDEFVREAGDKPIILAAHSQGALHLERLLAEKVAGKPIAKRIVAAYVVGWPISTTADLPALGLPACTSASEAGCILSWMTFAEPANADLILEDWAKTRGLAGGERKASDVLCVNPLTGTQNGAAPPAANGGTLVPYPGLRAAALRAHLVGARCDKGLLLINGPIPPLGPYVLPGNNYHVYDYALFWDAIWRDANRRLEAWSER